jgi:glycerate kinase
MTPRMALAGIPTTVLVAPDTFKGTLMATDVAAAIGRGLSRAGIETDLCPIADGGEGTLDALADPLGAEVRTASVQGPMGRAVEAPFGLTPAGRRGATAVVEAAAASGLHVVDESERDPVKASTFGTGQLIAAALEAGARTVIVGAGGTATTDGGSGAIDALRQAGGLPAGARLVVLCDVRTPFEDAARLFAAQKGATPEQVRRLTRRLHALARRFDDRDPRGVPLTGAAGGLSGGLWAAFGAELLPGASHVLDAIGFEARLRRARAVVTGEGRLDEQSLAGKALSEVATRARQSGVPCHAIVGSSALDRFGMRILDLQAVLEAGGIGELTAAGERLARLL